VLCENLLISSYKSVDASSWSGIIFGLGVICLLPPDAADKSPE